MNDENRSDLPRNVLWKSLPPLNGGVFVAMVTEVLEDEGIPFMTQTTLEAGGLGVITGTLRLGEPWRIQVPDSDYERAMEIFKSLMGEIPPSDADGMQD
jgi:hypothetical protein